MEEVLVYCHVVTLIPFLFVCDDSRDIIEDVEKLDAIEDSFIHFQLLRFCQDTRLQHINSHILLDNRCVLQQQHK